MSDHIFVPPTYTEAAMRFQTLSSQLASKAWRKAGRTYAFGVLGVLATGAVAYASHQVVFYDYHVQGQATDVVARFGLVIKDGPNLNNEFESVYLASATNYLASYQGYVQNSAGTSGGVANQELINGTWLPVQCNQQGSSPCFRVNPGNVAVNQNFGVGGVKITSGGLGVDNLNGAVPFTNVGTFTSTVVGGQTYYTVQTLHFGFTDQLGNNFWLESNGNPNSPIYDSHTSYINNNNLYVALRNTGSQNTWTNNNKVVCAGGTDSGCLAEALPVPEINGPMSYKVTLLLGSLVLLRQSRRPKAV